jgi:hypothetical protein
MIATVSVSIPACCTGDDVRQVSGVEGCALLAPPGFQPGDQCASGMPALPGSLWQQLIERVDEFRWMVDA